MRIMESDVDSAPWRDELVTNLPEVNNGYMTIPTSPRLGHRPERRSRQEVRLERMN